MNRSKLPRQPMRGLSIQRILLHQNLWWLEQESKTRKIHIHYAMCGHGGERLIERSLVDGYDPITKTVYQYHGCHWHECLKCFPKDRDRIIDRNNKTREELYQAALERTRALRKAGYCVIEKWACQVGKREADIPSSETRSYPHAIFYDFEAYLNKNKRKKPTDALTLTNTHILISVPVQKRSLAGPGQPRPAWAGPDRTWPAWASPGQ